MRAAAAGLLAAAVVALLVAAVGWMAWRDQPCRVFPGLPPCTAAMVRMQWGGAVAGVTALLGLGLWRIGGRG